MVHQIIKSKYQVFIEALILTFLILLIGFFIGYFVENLRTSEVSENYKIFELSALDLKLQNYYYQIMDNSTCDSAVKQNFIFADEIYKKGLLLQQYEDSNELTQDIVLEKKKYVLLKTELWLNTILLKEKCKEDFHTLVYIYSQEADEYKEAEQGALANILRKIKEERGNELILLPLAGDLDLGIVNMQLDIYNITNYPSIIIDEKIILEGFQSQEDIEKYLD